MATIYGKRPTIIGEVGRTTLTGTIDDEISNKITFSTIYNDPVVIVFMETNNDGTAVEARVKDVTGLTCEIFMSQDDNGTHSTSETVCYIVMEKGVHEIEEGVYVEAGSTETDKYHRSGASTVDTTDTVSFEHSFATTPIVLHSLNSFNNEQFMSTIVTAVSTSSFTLQQEVLQTNSSVSTETFAWIAVTTGDQEFFEASFLSDIYTHSVRTVSFTKTYSETPVVIFKGYQRDGGDGYYPRGASTGSSSASITIFTEEDAIYDAETDHTTEELVYMAIQADMKFYEQYILNRKNNR